MKEISIDLLDELFLYDAETGALLWRERGLQHFRSERFRKRWNSRYAGKVAFPLRDGYRAGMVFRSMFSAHRIAWTMHYGRWPECEIDHINGVRDDNRICNLRDVTRSENSRNAKIPKNNTSGAVGVMPHKDRWRAYIRVDRTNKHLGIFPTMADAIFARKAAEGECGYHENHGRA